MKKLVYKVVVSDKGFEDFEAKVSEKLNQGWKPIGGIVFNHSYPHQAMAKVVEVRVEKNGNGKTSLQSAAPTSQPSGSLTANQAMKRLSDIT